MCELNFVQNIFVFIFGIYFCLIICERFGNWLYQYTRDTAPVRVKRWILPQIFKNACYLNYQEIR